MARLVANWNISVQMAFCVGADSLIARLSASLMIFSKEPLGPRCLRFSMSCLCCLISDSKKLALELRCVRRASCGALCSSS